MTPRSNLSLWEFLLVCLFGGPVFIVYVVLPPIAALYVGWLVLQAIIP